MESRHKAEPNDDAFKKEKDKKDQESEEKFLTDAQVWAFVAKKQHWHTEA